MLRLAIRVPPDDAGTVLAELLQFAPNGVEQVDGEGFTEYAIYGAPGELPSLPLLETVIAGVPVGVSTTEVEDGWEERWRTFHRPLVIAPRLRVRPPWEPAGDEAHDLVIDPGRAFGTGAHPTTSLCLELLLGEQADGALADIGCGSGVIAILAAKLGFTPVRAVDNDPLAVEATVANSIVNQVAVDARRIDIRSDPLPVADLVVANILAPVLVDLAGRLVGSRALPRRAMLSGILQGQEAEVVAAWEVLGFRQVRSLRRSDWVAVVLERDIAAAD